MKSSANQNDKGNNTVDSAREVYRQDASTKEMQETMDKEIVKGNTFTRFVDGALSGLISGVVLQPL
jgi:hypothetical protein